MTEIMLRKTAKAEGFTKYFTGKPCKHGHISERWVASGACRVCTKLDKEGAKKRQERFKEKNIDRLREIKRESMRKSRKENKYKHMEYARKRMRALNKTEKGKLKQFVKGALRRCLKHKNGRVSYNILGYGFDELKSRIEFQFKDGMSWENYGEWHIDHKKSIHSFLSQGETNPMIINALSNLQPLWAFDNISKGAK